MKKKYLIVFLLLTFLIVTPIAIHVINQYIINKGVITAVNIEVNPNVINWGSVDPSSIVSKNIKVSNTGTIPLTLSMSTQGLPSYLTLNWDCTDYIVNSGEYVNAKFDLIVDSKAPMGESFSFNITITGTG